MENEKQIQQHKQKLNDKLFIFEKSFLNQKTEAQNESETKIYFKIPSTITYRIEDNSKQMKNDYLDSFRQVIDFIKPQTNPIPFDI
ncbi:hypothetical protein TRFO_17468 [Tritrichomonas foetus]|uniref:Uncharacterized protein n=1 Tax=Tritrichomonas foetus TaxID=1144522 RepID=A0A1J4KT33_9EUKA|nr:hypothetical protein TRFO_17468 [Tritrichomonas foetus]|eukprot:OHT12645.1 hypothetical protein TRFO_17468 [Tritrichomonas foetus]